ncbi:MAG: hypothetical protein ACKVP0_00305 [Pirellulaceae bacterium]
MFTTKLSAIAQCDREEADGSGCVVTERYEVGAEEVSLETFCQDAKEHFESLGWRFFGGVRCPDCAGVEPGTRPCRDCNGQGNHGGDGFSEDTQTCGSCGGRGCVPA